MAAHQHTGPRAQRCGQRPAQRGIADQHVGVAGAVADVEQRGATTQETRQDVVAVVHSHSPGVIPFGVTGNRLRPVYHMAGFLGSGSALFDIRDGAGHTDMLIRNPELGRALATSLSTRTCVLMRGHGSTTVGASIEQVVYRAIYAENNAKLQSQAMAFGDVNYLSEQEADLAAAANDTQIGRSWDLWLRRVGKIED